MRLFASELSNTKNSMSIEEQLTEIWCIHPNAKGKAPDHLHFKL